MPPPVSLVDRRRIARARLLVQGPGSGDFDSDDFGPYGISTALECYCTHLATRPVAPFAAEKTPLGERDITQLLRATFAIGSRIGDLLTRLHMIEWMRLQFAEIDDPQSRGWSRFASLAIKDFHVDAVSLLDAVALVVIRASCVVVEDSPTGWLPGWPHLVGRPYAAKLPQNVRDLVVALDEAWADHVREIRNLITHREHERVVFHGAGVGTYFQIYEGGSAPQILDPRLLDPKAHNVVNFALYSAFVLGELLVFFEDLGLALAMNDGVGRATLNAMTRLGDFSVFVDGLDALLAITRNTSCSSERNP